MKRNHIAPLILFLGALSFCGFLAGCDSELAGINNSPNAILSTALPTPEAMQGNLVAIHSAAGDWYVDERSRILSIWTMQMCAPPGLGRPQPVTWNTYKMVRDEHVDRSWLQAYRVVKIANDIISTVGSVGFAGSSTIDGARMTRLTRNTMLGIAKFNKALALGECAALYGSIPLDVAARAEDPPPAFVSQSAAYAYVQQLLDEAITSFTDSTVSISQDLNFGAATVTVNATQRQRWIEASNSLKARYYLHVKNYASALTRANAGISAATGTVNAIFTTTSGEYSPWYHWSVSEAGEPLRATKYFIDLLKSEPNDNRLAAYFSTKGGATQILGFDVYGDGGGTGDELVTTRAAGLVKYRPMNQPFPLISYQENILIRAEARARAGDFAGARADVNIIRTAAGLTARDNTTLPDANVITEILKQKYLQLHLEGQAYHDMRRTGTLVKSGIPVRWIYGINEYTTNPNVPKPEPAANEVL